MKKILQFSIFLMAFLAVSHTTFAQKTLNEGVVKFKIDMGEMSESPEMAMMGDMSVDFYFTKDMQRMDMNMMAGMMRVQTIVPVNDLKSASLLMDMMGQKYHIIELTEEELSSSNSFMNVDNLEKVTYDKKDKKEIAGYKCYKAQITTKDGAQMTYYITEKIRPPVPVSQKDAVLLKGYPLEMIIDTGQGFDMTLTATEVTGDVEEEDFAIGEGYKKITMEEFEKEMGEGLLGPGN